MVMASSAQIAEALLSIKAVFLRPNEPFTWASGIKSPIYCDNRLILSYPETRQLIEQAIADTIAQRYPATKRIMGTATAGIAHAALVAERLGLPMGYVRGSAKDHGRKNQIEGRIEPGDDNIPRELEEAARIDGCGYVQTWVKVIFPIARPGIMTAAVLAFLNNWNEYYWASLVLITREKLTVPALLSTFTTAFNTNYNGLFSAMVVIILPPVILYCVFSKFFIEALSGGAVKG